MPHLFVNRPRLHHLTRGSADLQAQFRWESINAVLYKVGGVVFMVGSASLFPRFEINPDFGPWTFFFGSLIYLVVTGHDMAESIRYQRTHATLDLKGALELIAASAYLFGTILFTVGSIFFLSQVGWFISGASCFVAGSLLFVLGACINVLQIVEAASLTTLQLMNLTAISFIVGSVLFTVASVPYLWNFKSDADRSVLYGFLAW